MIDIIHDTPQNTQRAPAYLMTMLHKDRLLVKRPSNLGISLLETSERAARRARLSDFALTSDRVSTSFVTLEPRVRHCQISNGRADHLP